MYGSVKLKFGDQAVLILVELFHDLLPNLLFIRLLTYPGCIEDLLQIFQTYAPTPVDVECSEHSVDILLAQ